jgi:DNA repair protein SbcC/Rad50
MIPRRVTLENFLSFGARTELAFEDDEPLWVVGGPNGVGKSAVFDAITFCLFGVHRGGKQKADHLIHHGANGFAVSFEFDFNGSTYRIARNRMGRPTQSVERRLTDATWERVANIDGVEDITAWSVATLGLTAESFQASVLLRQGKADAIVEAKPAERFKILRGIIGGERYEALSERVHEAARTRSDALKKLLQRRETTEEVGPERVAAAEGAEREAFEAKEAARLAGQEAAERRSLAKTWGELHPQRHELDRKIAAAAERASDADRIRLDHARFEELRRVLPVLRPLTALTQNRAGAEERLAELRRVAEESEQTLAELIERQSLAGESAKNLREVSERSDREAKEAQKEIDRVTIFRDSARESEAIGERLRAFPESLDADRVEATGRHAEAKLALQQTRDAVSRVETLLDQAKGHQRKFDALETGVPCSACGQEVTAEHAERERRQAADAVRDYAEQLDGARLNASRAGERAATTEQEQTAIEKRIRERDDLRLLHAERTASLRSLGGTAEVVALEQQLAELTLTAERHERERDEAGRELANLSKQASLGDGETARATLATQRAKKNRDEAEKRADLETSQCDLLRSQLPSEWPETGGDELDALDAEFKQLEGSGIAGRFAELERESTLLGEWCDRREKIDLQLQSIPKAARIPIKEAEHAYQLAKEQSRRAEEGWQTARDQYQRFVRLRAEFEELRRRVAEAETEARIHARLNELLGRTGLQRELVRNAEREIVHRANQTVGQLSDGDLSIELDPSVQRDDEALALCVRRGDDPEPIPVEFLSGSQKFRAAVALALAIGRFAAGQARPLECVIIDEGFGSLDQDGLRAMADELTRLKDKLALKRIVLVSHQDDFVSRFPVGWKLSRGENGTVAERFRR